MPIIMKDMEITIKEYRDRMEMNEKHFETKIAHFGNRKKVVIQTYKVVIQTYNSTQNLKVDGSIYSYFLEHFLVPLVMIKN